MADPSFARLEDEKPIPVPTNRGYSSTEAAEMLKKWGKNEIPEEKVPLWYLFGSQFLGPMPMMIELAGFLSLVLQSYIDFWIIFALLMTNATLGFVEEMNAQAAIGALKDGLTRKLPVKRDGVFTPLDVTEIVPGDCVFIRGGNVIPADGYWVEGDELAVDQAALTGESLPVQVPREDSDGEPLSGKRLWSGSILKTGECEYWVESTGLNTMMGEAAKSIQESGGKHVGVFEGKIIMAGRVLIIITLVAVGALLFYQVGLRHTPLVEVGEMSLSLIIASVPIALPMVLKVTLSVGAKEMAKEGGIVTHLTALEEIASMKVLCSDKTGTLTTAKMTVYHENAAVFNGYSGEDALTYAAIASNAANKDDAIDSAVYKAFAKMKGFDKDVDAAAKKLETEYETIKKFGFNPMVKRTVADVVNLKTNAKMRVAKGIVSKCTKTDPDDGGEQWEIAESKTMIPAIKEADATFGKSGYKTIAVVAQNGSGPMKFVGLLPIMDPPREDTLETIAKIRNGFVEVKMITGDHLNIAKELARQIELGTNIYSNQSLWPQSQQRDDLILTADGFAQVMPKDKHEVVAVLQQKGFVVGMTGDGVNDAPALAKAQIGIAVEGATDAAQAAADIVLTLPGLSPIFTAIMESRRIFKRLKSYVIYRICVTVQVVCFLCIISFAFNDTFEALYIILLALFHDLTIVTIAYDHQKPSPRPETPTVKMLIFVAYTLGFTLSTCSVLLYMYGGIFLSERFTTEFEYKESTMFLQISNSSAILIFTARTIGWSFLSKPCLELFMSAVVSQAVVNLFLCFSDGLIVVEMDPTDMAYVWMYDFSWLAIMDLVKMTILYAQGFMEADTEAERPLKAAESIGTGKYMACGYLGAVLGEFGCIPLVKGAENAPGARLSKGSRRPSVAGPMAGVPVIIQK
jgi:H+-transporting ATPase